MKKVLGIIVIIGLVVVIGYAAITISASSSCSRSSANKMPDIEYPCYLVTTVPPSLVYVGKSVNEEANKVVLERPYFVKIGGEWKFRDGKNELMRRAYKDIKVKLLTAP